MDEPFMNQIGLADFSGCTSSWNDFHAIIAPVKATKPAAGRFRYSLHGDFTDLLIG